MNHDHPFDYGEAPAEFVPAVLRCRNDGWTAERQRRFLMMLAETGSISDACREAGLTARSAYRLRAHPQGAAFARAWDHALRLATAKLMSLAYERAVRGSVRELWRDGKLISETRQPSDKLLMFLLSNLSPSSTDRNSRWARLAAMTDTVAAELPLLLEGLADTDVAADRLTAADYLPPRPFGADGDAIEPFDEDQGY